MAYIQPNSVLQLFKGINLDNRYLHTIYFGSESAQNSWFTGKVFKPYQNMSYLRYTVNQIKVKDDASSLLGCTYMRFQNNRAGDRWFYAFITAVEYLNENTALITYEIDVMQTWFIQGGSVKPCMVRREHVSDDTFGTNLETEPIGSEIYDYNFITQSNYFNNYSVIVSTSSEPDNMFDYGVFNGTNLMRIPCNSEAQADFVKGFLLQQLGSWDKQQQKADIVDLYMFPSDLATDIYPFALKGVQVNHPADFNGYTPKNNKMYGYPFSFLWATTGNGDSEMYRWEYWAGNDVNKKVNFGIMSNPTGGGMVECYPRDYNGIEEHYDMGLVIDNFPKCSGNIDAYQAWVASGGQTRANNTKEVAQIRNEATMLSASSNAITGAIQGSLRMFSGGADFVANPSEQSVSNFVGGINQTIQSVASYQQALASVTEANNKVSYEFKDAYYKPNVIVGKQTPTIGASWRTMDFYFYNAHIRNDEAKRVDDFLTMYGYAINRVKAPNISGRQYWNFVKTENAVIAGDMPASSRSAIAKIFDGGITFWHDGDNIGNYAVSVSSGTINNPIV